MAGRNLGRRHVGRGEAGRRGAHRSGTRGKIRLFGRADGLPCETSHRGFIDHLNRLWVATACGIFRNDRPSASDRFRRMDQPASLGHAAWAVSEDQQGTMWVTNPDGLWRLSEGRWRQYRKADGLLSDSPYIVAVAADGALWLRHRLDAGVERVEFLGDRILRSTPVVPDDALSVEVTAFHGFDAFGPLLAGRRRRSVGAGRRRLERPEYGRRADLERYRRGGLLGRCGRQRLDRYQRRSGPLPASQRRLGRTDRLRIPSLPGWRSARSPAWSGPSSPPSAIGASNSCILVPSERRTLGRHHGADPLLRRAGRGPAPAGDPVAGSRGALLGESGGGGVPG